MFFDWLFKSKESKAEEKTRLDRLEQTALGESAFRLLSKERDNHPHALYLHLYKREGVGHSYTIFLYFSNKARRDLLMQLDICVESQKARALIGKTTEERSLDNFDGLLLRLQQYLREWRP